MGIEPELMPCPFCGGKATQTIGGPEVPDLRYWVIGCYFNNCPVEPVFYAHRLTEVEAITAWNTRATPTGDKLDVC